VALFISPTSSGRIIRAGFIGSGRSEEHADLLDSLEQAFGGNNEKALQEFVSTVGAGSGG
jgi:hypothetical protein